MSFHMSVCLLDILFGKMFVTMFCPLSNWIVYVFILLLGFKSSLYIVDPSPFVRYTVCTYFLPVCRWPFHPLNWVFCRAKKFFTLMRSNLLVIIFFMDCAFDTMPKNSSLSSRS